MNGVDPFEPTPAQRAEFRLRICRLQEIAKQLREFCQKAEGMAGEVCSHVEKTWDGVLNAQRQRDMATGMEFLPALLRSLYWGIEAEVKHCCECYMPREDAALCGHPQMEDLEQTEDIEDADDFEMPKTWKGKMEALVAGAIDYDDQHELAMECAELADKTGFEPSSLERIPPRRWFDAVPVVLDRLLESERGTTPEAQKLFEETAAEFVHCGELADAAEAGEVPATT
jgi:hypothetical protein